MKNRKKRVAVFVNGWNAENVYRYLTGLSAQTPDGTIDYCVFVCHAIYSCSETEIKSAVFTNHRAEQNQQPFVCF